MSKLSFFLLLIISLWFYSSASAQVYQEYLLSGWTFKSEGADIWLPAEVPGSVQSDLQLNGREAPTQMDKMWLYNTHFIADELILARDHVDLVFEGLDTQADVYLNDQLILQADNMFRSWMIPVKDVLKKGKNELQISFKANKAAFDPSIRKANYHFKSQDPSQMPLGIWKPVILKSWSTFNATGAYIIQHQITGKEASLEAIVDLKATTDIKVEIEIYDEISNRTYKKHQVNVQHGDQQLRIPFTIRNPKLWWPVSLGDPNLYVIGIRVKGGSNEQNLTKRIGLREVEIQASGNNRNPSIRVNGKEVALKGTSYLPSNLFTGHMSSDDYDLIFKQLIDKKLNAIYVSENGIYESEYFYDLADIKGFMIVQDFMFPKHEYPSTTPFIENVKEEVSENIKLLRQHPSLVLWTGRFDDEAHYGEKTLERILKERLEHLDPFRPLLDSGFTDGWVNNQ